MSPTEAAFVMAELRVGDIVKVRHSAWPETTYVQGPVFKDSYDGNLRVGAVPLREWEPYLTIELVKRVKRAYVNSDREEPISGDVCRNADNPDDTRVWMLTVPDSTLPWVQGNDRCCKRDQLPERLLLLVDGETGQAVPNGR